MTSQPGGSLVAHPRYRVVLRLWVATPQTAGGTGPLASRGAPPRLLRKPQCCDRPQVAHGCSLQLTPADPSFRSTRRCPRRDAAAPTGRLFAPRSAGCATREREARGSSAAPGASRRSGCPRSQQVEVSRSASLSQSIECALRRPLECSQLSLDDPAGARVGSTASRSRKRWTRRLVEYCARWPVWPHMSFTACPSGGKPIPTGTALSEVRQLAPGWLYRLTPNLTGPGRKSRRGLKESYRGWRIVRLRSFVEREGHSRVPYSYRDTTVPARRLGL